MTASSSHEIIQLLVAWSDVDQAALEQLTPLVYGELHRLARGYLQTTARILSERVTGDE